MLEVKNIHKKFGSNEVLKGVDFKVEKGSVIAVLGNSGSGKTTLLRCISFLEQADKGEITFDDFHKDITAVTGYVRGGCTPIGMKKQFPTFIQESAQKYDQIYVSGGRIGYTLKLSPQDLAGLVHAVFADFIVK